jgi:hypothetical protein
VVPGGRISRTAPRCAADHGSVRSFRAPVAGSHRNPDLSKVLPDVDSIPRGSMVIRAAELQRRGIGLAAIGLCVLIATGAAASAAPEVTDATVCGLLTTEQVSAATKGGVESATSITFVTTQTRDVTCTYKSARSTLDDVQLVVSEPKTESVKAEDVFRAQQQHAVAQGNIYKRPPRDVTGIGDAAYWDQSFHNFVVLLRSRNLVIRVNARDQAGGQALAEAAVARLNSP